MSAKKTPAKEDTTSPSPSETPVPKATKQARSKTKLDASVAKRNMDVAEPSSGAQRVKIAELAAQLVAAQIAAHASYQAAVDVATEQRELMAESLETLAGIMKRTFGQAQEAATNQDRESNNAQDQEPAVDPFESPFIRNRLKYAGVKVRKPRVLSPLSGSELDRLFASAMYRAQNMLRAPEQDYRTVWAEQIFEEGETLSENQIWETFKHYGWPDLSARNSVITLMRDVDCWFSEHYRKLEDVGGKDDQGSEPENAQDETAILVRAMDLGDERGRDSFNHYRRDYKAVADAIKCFSTI